MTFPTGALPEKGPGPPIELLLIVAPKVLPGPALGADLNENNGFGFSNKEVLGFVLLVPVRTGFGPFLADVCDVEANNPSYFGFVSAFSPLEGIGDGVPGLPLDEPIVDLNNLPVRSVLESVRLVAPLVDTVDFGLILSGFGEGVLSF